MAGAVNMVAFSGARRLNSSQTARVAELAAALTPAGAAVLVGCAPGVDAVVRARFPAAQVFAVASGKYGDGPPAYARRSAAMVRTLAAAGSGALLVAFPTRPCPSGVVPASSWRSGRPPSGTWSTAALAVGLGCALVVAPLVSLTPPRWANGTWQEEGALWRWEPAPSLQLPLF